MTEIETTERIIHEFTDLQDAHPNCELLRSDGGQFFVSGDVDFVGEFSGRSVVGQYTIQVEIGIDYPHTLPACYETGGKISVDFHRLNRKGALCLAAPALAGLVFGRDATLAGFVNNLVMPYLFSHACYVSFGVMPFGELDHGVLGLVQFYMEYLEVDALCALRFLRALAEGTLFPLKNCPCGSGLVLRECHLRRLDELRQYNEPEQFQLEIRTIIAVCRAAGVELPYWKLSSDRTKKRKLRALAMRHSGVQTK